MHERFPMRTGSLIAIALCLASQALAQPQTVCEELLVACDRANQTLEEQIKADTRLIQKQQELLKNQTDAIEDLENPPVYKNRYLWGAAGLLIGGWIVNEIKE